MLQLRPSYSASAVRVLANGRLAGTRQCRVLPEATSCRRRGCLIRALEDRSTPSPTSIDVQDSRPVSAAAPEGKMQKRLDTKRKTKVDSTDAVATFLTRRFGLAGGMVWLGILAAGTIGEQVKTRLEVAAEEDGKKDVLQAKEVELPSGVRYTDMRIGAGALPRRGDLVVVDYMLSVDGKVVEDTTQRGRPVVFVWGARPFSGGLCAGTEEAMATMRAGGRRRMVVPPELGFADGTILHPKDKDQTKAGYIPPGSTLYYDLQMLRVSIAPS